MEKVIWREEGQKYLFEAKRVCNNTLLISYSPVVSQRRLLNSAHIARPAHLVDEHFCLPPSHVIYLNTENQTQNTSFSNMLWINCSGGHCALNNVKRFRRRLVYSYRHSKKTVVLYLHTPSQIGACLYLGPVCTRICIIFGRNFWKGGRLQTLLSVCSFTCDSFDIILIHICLFI